MTRLSERPRPENVLTFTDETLDVTICADHLMHTYLFVGFDRETLHVRWLQRAPGSFSDPRGHHDHRGRDGLWRSFLDRDHRALLDRFQPLTLSGLIDDEVSSIDTDQHPSGQHSALRRQLHAD